MRRVVSDGVQIDYDDFGAGEPAILCLPGWCVHRTLFRKIAGPLSEFRRVIALDWRGHGTSGRPPRDFGVADLVTDALAVIAASGVSRVVPLAQGHAGWVAVELGKRLHERVPKMILLSWLLSDPPPILKAVIQALQDRERWRQAREELLSQWLQGAPPELSDRIRTEMGSHSFEMWARSGREIAAAYAREGTPIDALRGLTPPRPVLHLFCQPSSEDYLAAQQEIAREYPWFKPHRLEGFSHFPTLEVPHATATAVERFLEEPLG